MQNNAQNNWKQLLENTDAIPGEIFPGKNTAWEKLYTRLHKKPMRKLLAWHWAAAACVVLASTAIIFLAKGKHQPSLPVTSSSTVNNQPSPGTNNSLATETKNRNDVSFRTLEKNSRMVSSRKKNMPVKKEESANSHNLIDDATRKELLTETVHQPISEFDSLKEITTAAPVKKKLKVVHINDLGQPMEESTADNKFAERHRLQLRIINSENYNPVSTTPVNNGIILFKSKSTTN